MKTVVLLLAGTALALTTTSGGQGVVHLLPPSPHVPLLPADESEQDRSLRKLRDDLLTAIREKDATKVWASFSPDSRTLRVSGLQESLKFPDSPDWDDLHRILSLGGTFTTTRGAVPGRREFCAPYTYSAYPSPYPRGFRGQDIPWVIISDLALVRSRPDAQTPVLLQLSHELVAATNTTFPTDAPVWSGVILADGREGWVLASDIRDPSDYHICFAKFDGVWLMTTFEQRAPGQW